MITFHPFQSRICFYMFVAFAQIRIRKAPVDATLFQRIDSLLYTFIIVRFEEKGVQLSHLLVNKRVLQSGGKI